jgi:hypothetical protein
MQFSIKVKLIPTQEQKDILLKMIKTYKEACNFFSQRRSHCGCIDKHNRKNQSSFFCKSCGFSVQTNFNGGIDIAPSKSELDNRSWQM